jgi:PAS domain S-box-containing protein
MLTLEIFKKPTIFKKLLIWFLMISLLPISIFGYVTFKTSERKIKEETLKSLMAITESKEVLFNKIIQGQEREIRELAFTPTIIEISEKYHVAFHVGGFDSQEYISLERKHRKYFTNFVNKFGYHDLLLADIDGNVFFTVKKGNDLGSNLYTGPYKDTELAKIFEHVMKSEKTGKSKFTYYAPSNMHVTFISTPIFNEEDNVIGAVTLRLAHEEIYKEVQNYKGLGQTGEIVIASREGNEAVFIAPLRHDPEAAFNRRVVLGSKKALPIQRAVQGEYGSGLSVDYRNKKILAVWRYLPYLKWGLVLKMDSDEAYKHIYSFRYWTFFIGLITLLVVSLIALRISRSISKPINALHKGSEIIGSGNLDYKVGTDAIDEIGELSRSFDEMTLKLKKSRKMLKDEIKEHKKLEIALRISEEQFRGAFETSAIGIAMVSPEGRWLRVNPALCNIVGYSEQELLSLTFQDITYPEDLKADLEYVKKMLAGEIRYYHMEKRYIHKQGHIIWILLSVSLVRDESGKPLHFVSQIQDITDRKRAELQIKKSLEEKDVLLKEIHHRVKNNMTVIYSLLKLQAKHIKDEQDREMFNESMSRIKSMALIHEKLYRSEDLAKIIFSEYIKDMIDSIFVSYRLSSRKVTLKKDIERITLGIDDAIPCGLIVNELLSNSLKYAFPEGRDGEIRVILRTNNKDKIELMIGDNGIGMPEGLDFRKPDSLGLNLVNALVRQLEGNIELCREKGTEFQITFGRRE